MYKELLYNIDWIIFSMDAFRELDIAANFFQREKSRSKMIKEMPVKWLTGHLHMQTTVLWDLLWWHYYDVIFTNAHVPLTLIWP